MSTDFSRDIFRAFKRKGLSIEARASQNLARVLAAEVENGRDASEALNSVLGTIRTKIERKEIKTNVITVDAFKAVVAEMTEGDDDLQDTSTQVIDAFSR